MQDLVALLECLGRPRLLVVGDCMLDRYLHGQAQRISPEAPVLVLEVEHSELRPGGAASVAALCAGLDASVTLAGVRGEDDDGDRLCRLLQDTGIDCQALLADPRRPTTCKERLLAHGPGRPPQPLLRIDREDHRCLRPRLQGQMLQALDRLLPGHDAVLVSDYAKGVCSPELLRHVLDAAAQLGMPVLVDPGRRADYRHYRGAGLLTPNRAEAELAAGWAIRTPAEAIGAAILLGRLCPGAAVLLKLDRDGMVLVDAEGGSQAWPPATTEVKDVTGAGDMVLAMAGLCRASGMGWPEAAALASTAAGLQVQKPGVAVVSRAEVRLALQRGGCGAVGKRVSLAEMAALAESYRRAGKRLVFTNGCFDLLHAGHVACLQEAARQGDVLVVAVNSDASVRRLKGPGRPVVGQEQRTALLEALACVDHVLIFDEDTPHALLEALRPDVLVKGGTSTEVVGQEVVEGYGGTVYRTASLDGLSTTHLLAAARSAAHCGRLQAH